MMKRTNKLFYLILCAFMTICYSKEYGWVNISSNLTDTPGVASLSDMYWINDKEGWICSGTKGEIYHTEDAGSTFTIQTTQYYTNAIHMLNSSEGYAGGYNGRVYRTTDGGSTWNVLGSIGGTLHSISFPQPLDTGYCSGDNGRIYRITPSGVSSMFTGLTSNLTSISFPENKQGWACGGSIITHCINNSWTTDQVYPSEICNSIFMIDNSIGWAAGDNGIVIKTADGINWRSQTNPDTLNRTLWDVFFLNSNEGWVVGNGGILLHSTDGGDTWNIEATGMTTNMLRSVQFLSSTNGYVIGNNGTLLHYTEINNAVAHKSSKVITDCIAHFDYSNGLVSIKTSENLPIEKISILDLQGKLLKETIQKKTINVSGLPTGIYFVKYIANAKINTIKIVKK